MMVKIRASKQTSNDNPIVRYMLSHPSLFLHISSIAENETKKPLKCWDSVSNSQRLLSHLLMFEIRLGIVNRNTECLMDDDQGAVISFVRLGGDTVARDVELILAHIAVVRRE